ncbi:MAG TPA: galactose-1-phosphate uridylyltransferase [Methanoregulaceae archaeon]|nr:MAG: galactose-1-phosphate uridylyltransferase [Methanolinea sp.]HON81601.1 galactose-1-phosphate uridylyltransferase [Methanoregulaceae archaeon]HPD10408.1 galactose-1-phosphate uridylyltransferase [Methanoregulaceae archaeon]HRT15350.1 galactose-1-phosphate uridylyltransferase [Methanoregulaceae archaeon]HRU31000.1 galactose-1-phosphate uridylyltransferase [Methanoregulaceae archaeon]
MFSVTEITLGESRLELREELLTGHRCKIAPARLNRRLDTVYRPPAPAPDCPFCRENVFSATPTFAGGDRICIGESLTFPNMFPFAEWHTVTVVTARHDGGVFSRSEILDALTGQIRAFEGIGGYKSINWNYLPSAGASIAHPHLQGLADRRAPALAEHYLNRSARYLARNGRSYWDDLADHEGNSPRFLFENELFWYAHHVPLGEREVRCILPLSTCEEFSSFAGQFADGLLRILSFYRDLGTYAFNMALFFDKNKNRNGFSSFCSIISRINPNVTSTSDTAFMERLHLEPVILTLPEEFGRDFKDRG